MNTINQNVRRSWRRGQRWTALLILLLTLSAFAETVIPDTPAGQALRCWLEAFNSGDRSKITSYYDRYQPNHKDRIDSLIGAREQTGGIQIIRVEKSEPLQLDVLMKTREESRFAQVSLLIDPTDDTKVKQVSIRPVPRPADQPATQRLTLPDAIRSFDQQAAELAQQDKFSGAVLIAQDGKIVLEKAYGAADRERQIGNTADTQFRLGSMNKMFTATAILQLAEAKKIDLSAPLIRYLPDYPNRNLASKVTIAQLLSHTGGTGDIFTEEYNKQRLETRELADYVKLFGARDLLFEPGSKWQYSNYGFVLLGAVMEHVSGVSYYECVRKQIFEPAGMRSTDSLPESNLVARRSAGYMRKNGAWISNADTLPWRGTPAGGGYSTVGDLFRFAEALSGGKLLSAASLKQMTSNHAPAGAMPPGQGYGFGMSVAEGPQGPRFGHGGGAPGMNGELRIYPRTDTVVVVLSNLDPPAATKLANFFDERMPLD